MKEAKKEKEVKVKKTYRRGLGCMSDGAREKREQKGKHGTMYIYRLYMEQFFFKSRNGCCAKSGTGYLKIGDLFKEKKETFLNFE